MKLKSGASNFSAAAALPARIAACNAFAAASTDCLALGAPRLAGAARRGSADAVVFLLAFLLAFLEATFLALVFARFGFTTLVDFGKAFLLKDCSTTVPFVVPGRQMFLACFVTPQSGFVIAWR
ncbi:MAG: hypothetical protein K2Y71_04885 [Xanthobacteraceae bacterium]|nr:hypothetical protein [Xanthobacteraceae bacterium]